MMCTGYSSADAAPCVPGLKNLQRNWSWHDRETWTAAF